MISTVAQGVLGRNRSLSVGQVPGSGSGPGRESIKPAKMKLCPDCHNPFASGKLYKIVQIIMMVFQFSLEQKKSFLIRRSNIFWCWSWSLTLRLAPQPRLLGQRSWRGGARQECWRNEPELCLENSFSQWERRSLTSSSRHVDACPAWTGRRNWERWLSSVREHRYSLLWNNKLDCDETAQSDYYRETRGSNAASQQFIFCCNYITIQFSGSLVMKS